MMSNNNSAQKNPVIRQQTHIIENEYINSMLNATCSDVITRVGHHDHVTHMEIDKYSAVECKVFRISGLNLALPLLSVKELLHQQEIILDNDKYLKTGLSIGCVINQDDVIEIIDLNGLINNDINDSNYIKRYDGKRVDIVLLKGSSIGIIYEHEVNNQTILHKDVCWRNEKSKRTWLAGTVKNKGFSILDVKGIHSLLNN
jgi:hypothetical protein